MAAAWGLSFLIVVSISSIRQRLRFTVLNPWLLHGTYSPYVHHVLTHAETILCQHTHRITQPRCWSSCFYKRTLCSAFMHLRNRPANPPQHVRLNSAPRRLVCPSRRSVLNEQLLFRLNLLMNKMLACSCQSVHQAPHYVLKYEMKKLTEMSGSSLLSCLLWKSKFKIIRRNNKTLSPLQFSPLCRTECDKNSLKVEAALSPAAFTKGLWQPSVTRAACREILPCPWDLGRRLRAIFARVPQASLPQRASSGHAPEMLTRQRQSRRNCWHQGETELTELPAAEIQQHEAYK